MNPKFGRARACPEIPVTPVILNGGAWAARRIRNHCLRQHCHVLATTFRRPEFAGLKARCARIFLILETRSRVLTGIHPNELAVVAAVARLGAYAGRWVRAPEDWFPDPHLRPPEQWADLLRHLLALFAVPVAFDKVWEIRGPLEHFERDCWCALARGQSLRSVHGFPPSISHRVLHAALSRDESSLRLIFTEAIWRVQLQTFNASPGLVAAVISSRAGREINRHEVWARLAAKFAAGAEADAVQFELVADALTVIREYRGSGRVDALLRLPLEALIRYCTRYVIGWFEQNVSLLARERGVGAEARALCAKHAAMRWTPRFGAEPFVSQKRRNSPRPWCIEELCSIDDLRTEGRIMSHCVASYLDRCRLGYSAVFSVRRATMDRTGEQYIASYATIEVHPRRGRVVQVRAYQNQPPNHMVMTIVREWATAKGLQCTY